LFPWFWAWFVLVFLNVLDCDHGTKLMGFLILSSLTLGHLGESLESLNGHLLHLQLRSFGLKILILIN
jgi:hypothetical protein